MFSQDFKELLSALNEHRVKYLIVGGYAVAVHAQPRATKDLDIFIESSPENAKGLYAALAKFGAPLGDLRPDDFTDPNIFFRMGTPPQMVEILSRISGVEFAQAWEHRIEAVIDEQTGLNAFIISADDLIANKIAFGRPYDLADVDAIRKAAEGQRPRAKKSAPEPTGTNR